MDPSLILRPIALGDFNKGYTKILKILTTVGEIQEEDFNKRLLTLMKNPVYQIWVIEDPSGIDGMKVFLSSSFSFTEIIEHKRLAWI